MNKDQLTLIDDTQNAEVARVDYLGNPIPDERPEYVIPDHVRAAMDDLHQQAVRGGAAWREGEHQQAQARGEVIPLGEARMARDWFNLTDWLTPGQPYDHLALKVAYGQACNAFVGTVFRQVVNELCDNGTIQAPKNFLSDCIAAHRFDHPKFENVAGTLILDEHYV